MPKHYKNARPFDAFELLIRFARENLVYISHSRLSCFGETVLNGTMKLTVN